MNTERATDFFLQHLLAGNKADLAFVEIGLGSCDWSFSWAVPRGFRCVAVEPVPVAALRQACEQQGVLLIEAAVGRQSETALLHCGELNGHAIPDTSSLKAQWWAAGTKTVQVEVVTVMMVLAAAKLDKIVCMKVDVEGAEADVLYGLRNLPESALPELVTFEYGGGGVKSRGDGGWSDQGWASTVECFQILLACGYTSGLLCERKLLAPVRFDLSEAIEHPEAIFPENAEVGNVIAWKGAGPSDMEVWIQRFVKLESRNRIKEKCRWLGTELRFRMRRYGSAIARRLFPVQ